jgi:hypothetical protein
MRRARLALALLAALAAAAIPARGAENTASAGILDLALTDEDASAIGPVGAAVDNILGGDEFHAAASANFGVVRASTSYQVDSFSRSLSGSSTITGATAQTRDTLTITGLPNGTAGKLFVTFTLDGAAAETAPGQVLGQYFFLANTPSQSFLLTRAQDGIVTGEVHRPPIDFVFGEPFVFTIQLQVNVEQTDEAVGPPFSPVFASIDYGDTVRWTGVAVTDASEVPVPGFAITSESGTQYPIPVPEPGAPSLLLAGAAALGALQLRRDRGGRA